MPIPSRGVSNKTPAVSKSDAKTAHSVTESSTNSCCLVPVLHVFTKLEEFLGKGCRFRSVNPEQERLLGSTYWKERKGLSSLFSNKELKGLASNSIRELNQFLKQEGYDIQLSETGSNDFGAVAFQDVSVAWKVTGKVETLDVNGTSYPGFILADDSVSIVSSKAHKNLIAVVTTENGDTVTMTRVDSVLSNWELLDLYESISKAGIDEVERRYAGVHAPMVSLEQEVDLTWLEGLRIASDSDGGQVSQAKQFNKFRMNQFGASSKSGVGVGLSRSVPRYLTMDGAFVLIMERRGVEAPTFLGLIDTDSFKDPGDLA